MCPKAAGGVSMLVPSIINAEFQAPLKCRLSLQSPAFSRSQLENRPLDSTKTQKKEAAADPSSSPAVPSHTRSYRLALPYVVSISGLALGPGERSVGRCRPHEVVAN